MATEMIASAEMREPRSSIEVTRNSKGFGWVAKTYANDGETDDELLARVKYINDQLAAAYGGGE